MKSDSKTPRKFQAIKLDIPCGLLLLALIAGIVG